MQSQREYCVDKAREVRGEFTVKIYRGGVLVETIADHNLIVTLGRKRLAELISGVNLNYVTKIGVGTGTIAADVDDTHLTGQKLFEIQSRDVEDCDAVFKWKLGIDDANGMAIREFGLFADDDVMITHRVRGKVIEKEDDIELEGEYRLKF